MVDTKEHLIFKYNKIKYMKRRVIEQTWPNGIKGYIIQKKSFFGSWQPLGENMTSGYKIYETMEEAREAISKMPGTCSKKVVYTEQ